MKDFKQVFNANFDTDVGYLVGKARNEDIEGDGTGSPWHQIVINDLMMGPVSALFSHSDVVADNSDEKAGQSQWLSALKTLAKDMNWGDRFKGSFAKGFTYTSADDVGRGQNGEYYKYIGSDPFPKVIPAGLNPVSFPSDYGLRKVTDHNNDTNRNAVGAHDDIYIRNVAHSQAIAEDAPIGTRYLINGARYDVVSGSDTGGFYIEGLVSGRKLKLVENQNSEILISKTGVNDGGNLSSTINSLVSAGFKSIKLNLTSGNFEAAITSFDEVRLSGLGIKKSLFTKTFDTLLFPSFGSGAELANMQITGGASPIIECPTGSDSQEIDRCRLIANGYPALTFDDQGGESIKCTKSIFGSGDTQIGGVALKAGLTAETGGSQRHFTDCGGAGNPTIDLSGMNDTFIVNGFSTNGFIFSDTTSKAFISNVRWGVSQTNPTDRLEVRGENINISNQVGLPLDLYCSASRISTITPDYDINDYGSGNMISVRARDYTPLFTGSGGTQPDIGNGTITGFYSREGNVIRVQVEIVWGSTSVLGDGRFRIGTPENMPVIQNIGVQQYSGSGILRSATPMILGGRFFNNERYFELGGVDNSPARVDVGSSTPLATGDRIWFEGSFVC